MGAEAARAAGDVAVGNKAGLLARGARLVGDKLGASEADQIKALRELLK